MARTTTVRLALAFALAFNVIFLSKAQDTNNATKIKRQIFREQVNPQAGGRIPEDAFRSDRLALNRLNKEGIAVPDGVVLEARHRESHYGSHRHDPDIQASIVKVVLGEDGRYSPPEGRYPFNSLVESTYVLRPPINTPVISVPPRRPHLETLRLPARPFFQQDHSLNSLDQQIEFFNSYDPNYSGTGLWTGLLGPVPDVPNRLLRRQAKNPLDDVVGQQSKVASKLSGNHPPRTSTLQYINSDTRDRQTDNQNFRHSHQGRNLQPGEHHHRSSEDSRPSYNSYSNHHSITEKGKEDFNDELVPVYLTPHKGQSISSLKKPHFVSYISPGTKFNYQPIIPIVNIPFSPNYYYQTLDDVTQEDIKPKEKIVKSRPHYVLDPYSYHNDKKLVPVDQKINSHDDQFHDLVQNPQVASALLDNQEQVDGRYQEITTVQHQEYGSQENNFNNIQDHAHANTHSEHLQQVNVLAPVAVNQNQPSPLVYNHIKQQVQPDPDIKSVESPESKNIHYQLIKSFNNVNNNNNNNNFHLKDPQKPNEQLSFGKMPEIENVENRNNYEFQNTQFVQNRPEYQLHPTPENYVTHRPISNKQQQILGSFHQQDQNNWHDSAGNNVKVISQENNDHTSDNNGVQFVRGGLQFEVVKDKLGIRQQSRGEIGQKSLTNSYFDNQNHNVLNNERPPPSDFGSKHLNQVLHYIEPHEMVQQISTAPSIENEYPSLETVPETSFVCQGPGRTMLPDPETSCQVFHLCSGDGKKESFLCPKGSRYDAHKQQCAPWTEVTCHA